MLAEKIARRLPSGTLVVQPMVTNACLRIARFERKLRDR